MSIVLKYNLQSESVKTKPTAMKHIFFISLVILALVVDVRSFFRQIDNWRNQQPIREYYYPTSRFYYDRPLIRVRRSPDDLMASAVG